MGRDSAEEKGNTRQHSGRYCEQMVSFMVVRKFSQPHLIHTVTVCVPRVTIGVADETEGNFF